MCVCVCVCVHAYDGLSESSKSHSNRMAEHFSSDKTLPFMKLKKIDSDFYINIYASRAHTKVRGVRQMLNFDEA